jgi:hypothetical protein
MTACSLDPHLRCYGPRVGLSPPLPPPPTVQLQLWPCISCLYLEPPCAHGYAHTTAPRVLREAVKGVAQFFLRAGWPKRISTDVGRQRATCCAACHPQRSAHSTRARAGLHSDSIQLVFVGTGGPCLRVGFCCVVHACMCIFVSSAFAKRAATQPCLAPHLVTSVARPKCPSPSSTNVHILLFSTIHS